MTGKDVDEDEQYCDNDTLMTCILLIIPLPTENLGDPSVILHLFHWDPTLQKIFHKFNFHAHQKQRHK